MPNKFLKLTILVPLSFNILFMFLVVICKINISEINAHLFFKSMSCIIANFIVTLKGKKMNKLVHFRINYKIFETGNLNKLFAPKPHKHFASNDSCCC